MTESNDSVLPKPVVSAEDVDALSRGERMLLARWLAHAAQSDDIGLSRARRRVGFVLTIGGAVLLIPWIAVLATTLPDHHSAHQWRLVWSGFDVALTLAFASTAYLGWRRRQITITALTVLGVLLMCDVWFDVTLSWGSSEQTASIITAIFVEIPVAVIALWLAH